MSDRKKTKEELIDELKRQRTRIAKLESREEKLKKAEKALIASEEKYRFLVESTDDSIYLVDKDCKYLYMNRRHRQRLGITELEEEDRSYSEFHTPEETEQFLHKVRMVFERGESYQFEYQSMRDKKQFFQTFSPVLDESGKVRWVTVVSTDITRLKELEDQHRTLSITDELTGLYNRRGFQIFAEMQFNIANRLGQGMYLLYADLDDLKSINDNFGHHEGDRAIIEASKILEENYRRSDIIARIGGDEFVIVPVGGSEDSVEMISARLQGVINNYNAKSELPYKVSVSIGLAFYDPRNPCTIDELLERADKYMYENKKRRQRS